MYDDNQEQKNIKKAIGKELGYAFKAFEEAEDILVLLGVDIHKHDNLTYISQKIFFNVKIKKNLKGKK